jgi:hypothetical protein
MLLGMPKISVSVSDEVHAAVRVRAFREGTSLAELGRRFFEGYGGLAAGDKPGAVTSPSAGSVPATAWAGDAASTGSDDAKASTAPAPAARPLSGFQPDFKKGK